MNYSYLDCQPREADDPRADWTDEQQLSHQEMTRRESREWDWEFARTPASEVPDDVAAILRDRAEM